MEIIRSRDNKLLKQSRKLNIRKYRGESCEFMIEGVRFIEEAVKSGASIKYCLCSESLVSDRVEKVKGELRKGGTDVYLVEDGLLKDICDTKTPQGIAAVVEISQPNMNLLLDSGKIIIMLDRIQDPGNLGTIIRTAHAAGAGGVILSEGSVDPYSPKVLRSTMGSIFHVPVVYSCNLLDIGAELKKKGYTIYASSLDASNPYYDQKYGKRCAVIIGNEANGIEKSLLDLADRLIRIPMPGGAESLNASVACGIILFEMVKSLDAVDK